MINEKVYCALLVIIRPTSVMLRRHSATGEFNVSLATPLQRESLCACDSERPCQACAPPHIVESADTRNYGVLNLQYTSESLGSRDLF